jgi:hypothetical protein
MKMYEIRRQGLEILNLTISFNTFFPCIWHFPFIVLHERILIEATNPTARSGFDRHGLYIWDVIWNNRGVIALLFTCDRKQTYFVGFSFTSENRPPLCLVEYPVVTTQKG